MRWIVADLGKNPNLMDRKTCMTQRQQRTTPWDVVVIGGGATGVAIAMDAAGRGINVLLLERSDFGKGTSSRSTKLVHGGVRYLRQGNITLVRDALRERTLLRQNAPHLVHDMAFLIPCENLWQRFFYWIGLKVYDCLATRNPFGRSHSISADDALKKVSAIRPEVYRGGVIYHDGQFDDARLLINMAQTAVDQGAALLNYVSVTGLIKNGSGKIQGVTARCEETQETFEIAAHCVINATGPFCDSIRRLDDEDCEAMLSASQGVHLVLPQEFFPGETAMIVPKTSDGRVLFVIPWHGHVIVGTTDTPIDNVSFEPRAQDEEIQFLLETAARYLRKRPTRDDVLSVFTGIRPLVKGDRSARTASLSRDHVIRVSPSGLLTITGGKWTTVRKMAEDCVDRLIDETELETKKCNTMNLPLHGHVQHVSSSPRAYYGTDLNEIETLESQSPELRKRFHESLPLRPSEVLWSVRQEMARTLEDVLARRSRCLFLNAAATLSIAPQVARWMADELGQNE